MNEEDRALVRSWQLEGMQAQLETHMYKLLGAQLQVNREARGISLEAMYQQTGVEVQTLRDIEAGNIPPDFDLQLLEDIAAELDLRLKVDFVGLDGLTEERRQIDKPSTLVRPSFDDDPAFKTTHE